MAKKATKGGGNTEAKGARAKAGAKEVGAVIATEAARVAEAAGAWAGEDAVVAGSSVTAAPNPLHHLHEQIGKAVPPQSQSC
jgi:hypothetical protein